MLALGCITGPTAPSPLIMLESEGVILLELDQLSLVRRQEYTTHEARYSQLLDHLQQVDLQIQLAQTLSVQPVLFFRCISTTLVAPPPCLPLTATASPGTDQPATANALYSLLKVGPEALRPIVAEYVPSHDRLF